ncbi:uncharacterized protein BCR38DRAFT_154082 [Pseudomassariella vexata]|uniref:non-specific serine/threonine protein kinase n=1 Tax=Pseudomassariella vexata TaxID=1141098 RepID=A0A1Y2E6U0_9PEZI|nr:uncharacterized protein BCR38DRAFT_154082 [Pseudomassariella vexata]ORY67280.1 hypothetical protein BCR38DRAFT_154082 [Pseudomassariella vexata]
MDARGIHQSQSSRAPLGDATDRVVNTSTQHARKRSKLQNSDPSAVQANPRTSWQSATPQAEDDARHYASAPSTTQSLTYSRVDGGDAEKRVSQLSTSSGASSGKRKTHVGPWQLGRTLGKGSAGRVRLARHRITQEQVAVKILPKHGCQMTQASSLASLDKWDRKQPGFTADNRMPLSIEREVAVLKLIDHPNIMKIFDIWENRSEIYLVLEYVEQGDLFEYINIHGPLPEEETIFFFRQMISALDYCHSFNICHRDLKPENILMTREGQIKIADFGMAAIQQSPNHKLKTACGSPHYAAPELVSRRKHGYRGDKVDIWSIGVILYACLSARLPFDDPNGDLPRLLAKAKAGAYEEPAFLSRGSKDLIRKMLQPEPNDRITIRQIWKHSFIVQYDYLDDLNGKRHDDQLNDIRKHGRITRLTPDEIDLQTLRQLKSMWHMFTERELALKLMNEEPNDQKLFYWLLCNYREKQLEDYGGDLTYSSSDYHHLRPANWTKKITTLEFPARYGRTPSRFTVISNMATDDNAMETATDGGGTIQSYDPYKSSRIMDDNGEVSHAKIIVHRNGSLAKSSTRTTNLQWMRSGSIKSSSTYSRRARGNRGIAAASGIMSSRRSLNSVRSGDGTHKRPASRHKRGVNFSHVRRRSVKHGVLTSIACDDSSYDQDLTSPTSPVGQVKRSRGLGRTRHGTQPMANGSETDDRSSIWNEDLRQFSYSIAKDCDEAFNSSLLSPDSYLGNSSCAPSMMESSVVEAAPDSKSLSVVMDTPTPAVQAGKEPKRDSRPWDARPLPPAPPPTDSILHELMLAKKRTELRREKSNESPGHVDRMMAHLNRLVPPVGSKKAETERRVASAPIYSQYSTQWGKDTIPLPSISENQRESSRGDQDKHRIVSAPVGDHAFDHRTVGLVEERRGLEYLARHEKTIRMVKSPADKPSPVKAPAPLNIRKKLSKRVTAYPQSNQELSLRQQYACGEIKETIPEELFTPLQSNSFGAVKKSSWFKRSSKDKDDIFNSKGGSSSSRTEGTPYSDSNASSTGPIPPARKKSFSFAFWRNSKDQEEMKLSLALGPEFDESPSPEPVRMFSHPARPPHSNQRNDDVTTRNIEPQQNWLARLFRVKPATQHICFTIPRRRARQEIAILLREWRRYGIRDVQVDKDRNLVFGRVGAKNYLNMKEVSFAAEIMTVIEHGKRNPLCIVRFTQERGAASSFHKVVDTMHAVFSVRNLLVVDKRKIKMMIKTLNS